MERFLRRKTRLFCARDDKKLTEEPTNVRKRLLVRFQKRRQRQRQRHVFLLETSFHMAALVFMLEEGDEHQLAMI
jgi:hypothetical protein